MLSVKHLRKTFSTGGHDVHAVDGVHFSVPTGKLVAIVGKSGSGKSTLLSLLGALDRPDEGEILVDETDVVKLSGHDLLHYRRSTIGFVFQNYQLVPNLTALENVVLPMEFAGMKLLERKVRAMHLLKEVGLTDSKAKRTPGKLSGGEQQRVAIARALANQPKLILADEPTGNLDSVTSAKIIDLLRSLAKSERATVVTVTHDQGIAQRADHVYRLHDGKLS